MNEPKPARPPEVEAPSLIVVRGEPDLGRPFSLLLVAVVIAAVILGSLR